MKYLDNLLDWGDLLFAQDSWETIDQATTLYWRALNLLGPPARTESIRTRGPAAGKRVGEVKDHVHTPHASHPDLAVVLAAGGPAEGVRKPFFDVPTFFSVPENSQFAEYWQRAQDRLHNIRYCLNFEGQARELPLFQPPIDPRQLIAAMAAGRSPDSAAARVAPLPHYRFAVMIQRARSVTARVAQLGSALLAALERGDVESLQVLRSAQEKAVLRLARQVKEKQIEDAEHGLAGLKQSRESARCRGRHFQALLDRGLSASERKSQTLATAGLVAQILALQVRGAAVGAHLIPTIYGTAAGGSQPGSSVSEAATLSDALAGILWQQSAQAEKMGQYGRRSEDWGLQRDLAGFDLRQIESHIEAAQIHLEITRQELELHEKTIRNASETEEFFKSRFTGKELQQWMIGRISRVYFQTYKLAYDLARSAERAYQYERHTDRRFVDFGTWDSLKKGLLAGEGLMLCLDQLEKAHLDGDARELEIEKTVSLLELDPEALLALKSTGKCTFELTERDFDYDFPGHYCRRIKSVSISIPAVVGPNQDVHATLTQSSEKVLLKPHKPTVRFLLAGDDGNLDGGESGKDSRALRSGWRPRQQIAISRGVDDSGMFQLDFRDERYLPFEGTGAISSWELSLPKGANRNLDFDSISEVVMKLRYTALDGGEDFREAVIERPEIQKYSGYRLLSLRQESSAPWHDFAPRLPAASSTPGGTAAKKGTEKVTATLKLHLTPDLLGLNCKKDSFAIPETSHLVVRALWDPAKKSGQEVTLKLSQPTKETSTELKIPEKSVGSSPLASGKSGQEMTLKLSQPTKETSTELKIPEKGVGSSPLASGNCVVGEWTITTEDRESLAGLLDLVFVVPFEGTLVWN